MAKAKVDKYYGTGRRKSAIARVWLTNGEGKIIVNGVESKSYLGRPVLEILVRSPFTNLELDGRYDVVATAKGGGKTGQAGALRLGIARAMIEMDSGLRPALKSEGFLSRDPRVKESKKYGRKKARRGFQYVKR